MEGSSRQGTTAAKASSRSPAATPQRNGGGGLSLTLMAQLAMLKLLAIVFTVSAICLVFTSEENVVVYNIPFSARFSYSSAYKFLVDANIIVSGCSVLSLICIWFLGKNISPSQLPFRLFYLLLHDLVRRIVDYVMMGMMTAGCAAASAVGLVGYNGIDEIGWVAICGNVSNFCHKMLAAVILSYFSLVTYLALIFVSAFKLAYISSSH
ncbi:CASP-like protein 1F2 [Linum grandiflorum]